MKNKVIVGQELEELKKELTNYVSSFKDSVENKDYFLVTNSSARGLGWVDALRFFVEGWNEYSSPVKNLILSSAYRINKTCPLALPLYFESLTGVASVDLGRSFRISSKEIEKESRKINDDFLATNFDLLMSALHEAGATGTIAVESSVHESEMFIDEGYETACMIDSFFEPYFETCQIKNCKIVVYDGAVIEVSQIHHILEKSYDTKQPIILICSSYSNDVSNTLLVNWEKGNTKVVPFFIEDSLETINEVKDISSALGQIPISKDNGGLLSSIDIDELKNFGISFNAEKKCLRILLDKESTERCMQLRDRLGKKLSKETVEDIQVILRKRISKLASRKVTVRVPFTEVERGILQDRAASLFTYFSKCAQQGVVDMGNSYMVRWLPAVEAQKALLAAKSDREALKKIKAVLRLEE